MAKRPGTDAFLPQFAIDVKLHFLCCQIEALPICDNIADGESYIGAEIHCCQEPALANKATGKARAHDFDSGGHAVDYIEDLLERIFLVTWWDILTDPQGELALDRGTVRGVNRNCRRIRVKEARQYRARPGLGRLQYSLRLRAGRPHLETDRRHTGKLYRGALNDEGLLERFRSLIIGNLCVSAIATALP